jgi:hypothetical protein
MRHFPIPRKHRSGCYRVSLDAERFAQIRRYKPTRLCPPEPEFVPDSRGRLWGVEIRDVRTGDVVRFGGVWSTLADAVGDLVDVSAALDRESGR